MEEPITQAVRAPVSRWWRASSVAVIALAVATVLVTFNGIDAWRDRWIRAPEHPTVSLVGTGTITGVPPDAIAFDVQLAIAGPQRSGVEQKARDLSSLTLLLLRASLRPDESDVRTDGLRIEETTDTAGAPRFRATQLINVRSTNSLAGLPKDLRGVLEG